MRLPVAGVRLAGRAAAMHFRLGSVDDGRGRPYATSGKGKVLASPRTMLRRQPALRSTRRNSSAPPGAARHGAAPFAHAADEPAHCGRHRHGAGRHGYQHHLGIGQSGGDVGGGQSDGSVGRASCGRGQVDSAAFGHGSDTLCRTIPQRNDGGLAATGSRPVPAHHDPHPRTATDCLRLNTDNLPYPVSVGSNRIQRRKSNSVLTIPGKRRWGVPSPLQIARPLVSLRSKLVCSVYCKPRLTGP